MKIKVITISAAKDMTVIGDVTFTNTNDAEDHALVLASADDFSLNKRTFPTQVLI